MCHGVRAAIRPYKCPRHRDCANVRARPFAALCYRYVVSFLTPVPAKIVCVIDDEPSVRSSTGALIRALGWGVSFFSCAESFIAHPSSTAYDCLICDIALEGISGLELLRRFRHAGHATPCIFVTAHGTPHNRAEAAQLGAACMLDKPVDPRELVDWLSRILGSTP